MPPSPRKYHSAVTDNHYLYIWGGMSPNGTILGDGARYDRLTDTWTAITMVNAPAARYGHTAVLMGESMYIWGGEGVNGSFPPPARYDTQTNTWPQQFYVTPTPTWTPFPTPTPVRFEPTSLPFPSATSTRPGPLSRKLYLPLLRHQR